MSRPQEGRPPPSDRELMPPPPRPRPPALFRTLGTTTTPIILSDTESESDSDDDDGSASSTPHASAGPPRDATQLMLDDLRSVLQGGRSGNFCIGGRIPIFPIGNFPTSSQEGRRISSVTLRFDTPDGSLSRIQFPLRGDGSSFEHLLRACTPSSFGAVGAGELDASHFSSDFHPHNCGIIDTIAQTLLPDVQRPIVEGTKGREEQWGVRAELSSLNIYSPSSTPPSLHHTSTSATHFGTLMIILPFPHQGGTLSLTHKIRTQNFTFNTPHLHYLAFHNPTTLTFSPLTSGNLITLNYTLHLTAPISHPSPLITPSLSPLHSTLRTLLLTPTFLPQGGTLGFYCAHPYAHTLRNASSLLPHSLKGIDASLFTTLNALGLKTTVRPILGDEAWDEFEEWKMSAWMESEDPQEGEVVGGGNVSRVGRGFGRIRMVDRPISPGEDPSATVNKFFPFRGMEDVLWLNEARHEGWEVQMVNLRSAGAARGKGQEKDAGGLMWHYSCVAVLCGVPGWRDRRGLGSLAEEEEEDEGVEMMVK